MIRRQKIRLTPTEYRLLSSLREGIAVSYAEITYNAYKCSVDDQVRIMIDKHIDRIRGKLRGTGIYVYCVLRYGYILLADDWCSLTEQFIHADSLPSSGNGARAGL